MATSTKGAQTTGAHLYELAKIGAKAQLDDLVQEIKLLVDLFPHLRDSIDTDELPVDFILERGRNRAGKGSGEVAARRLAAAGQTTDIGKARKDR